MHDLADLGEGGGDFVVAWCVQAALQFGQDSGLVLQAHADHEGESKALPVGVVECVEAVEFVFVEPVQAGRGLLGGGGGGEGAVDCGLAGQFRMRADQRQLIVG